MLYPFVWARVLRKWHVVRLSICREAVQKPFFHALSFTFEYVLISYLYVVLHNYLSSPELAVTLSKSLYFTAISASTVGYGDHFPVHAVTQWYVIVCMIMYLPIRFVYVVGSVGFIVKNYYALRRLGRWFPMQSDHIIVYCNAATVDRNNFIWLERFLCELHESARFREHEILFVNYNTLVDEKLNAYFAEDRPHLKNVYVLNAHMDEDDFFVKIHIDMAEHVFVLADKCNVNSDSFALDVLYRIHRETAYEKGVTVEVVHDQNRQRMRDLGATVLLRPNRAMPELLVTCTIALGAAEMIEEIVSRGHGSIERFAISPQDFVWGEFLYDLNMNGIGTAMAVIYEDGRVVPNPPGRSVIKNAVGILLLIHEMRQKSYDDIQQKIHTVFDESRRRVSA